MIDPILNVMTVPAPEVSEPEAEGFALAHWGLSGSAKLLTGERDRNFRLRATDGRNYVLKFANQAEEQGVTDMQVAALAHVQTRDPALQVPRMVPLLDGAIEARHGAIRVRMLTYLAGVPLRAARGGTAQRRACGVVLARLGIALEGFAHPASATPLVWDLAHILRLRDVVDVVPDAGARALIGEMFDRFEAEIAPILPGLRHQILYNDMNGGNVLVDPSDPDRVAGIIDFGDLTRTALAIDVAVGGTSQITDVATIPIAIGDFVAGFHATRPLLTAELTVLPLLMACRLSMGTALHAWHRRTHPNNPHYTSTDPTELQRRLAMIRTVSGAETIAAINAVAGA